MTKENLPFRETPAPLIGEHPALDLINTEARDPRGEAVDHWHDGGDVIAWLAQVGVDPAPGSRADQVDPDELLARARALRTLARRLLVERAQSSADTDIASLNTFLQDHPTTPHLSRDADGNLVLARVAHGEGTAAVLGPLAESVARFLVEADFSLVKKCEHPDCILWFYDRARGGRRRWCSMAVCGNRHKVARFRKRAAVAGSPPSRTGASS